MFKKKSLSLAVMAAVIGVSGAQAQQDRVLEEIIVTATKRDSSVQDIPVSVNAVSGDTLRDLHAETFNKYVEFLPNVVSAGNGPGKKEIYIRGSVGEQAGVTGPTNALQPGVALYVDEMPISLLGRNLDYYAADLERIEVLAGPQGTLFGASSQSGTVRLITAKPNVDGFEAGFNTKVSTTKGGSQSTGVDAFINIPLSEKLAVRALVYSDTQGGWVDNVRSSFTPNATVIDRNQAAFGPTLASADSVETAFNDNFVENDWNDASYQGARLGAKYDFNSDWSLLLQHTSQELMVDGTFLSDPSLGENNSAKFAAETNKDEFDLTTWTLEGRLAQLDIVYTGGFLDRDIEGVIDYTFYNNGGAYITYYLCSGNLYDSADPNNCFDPAKQFNETTNNQRQTHEFRINNDADSRLRYIAGIYYNDVETTHIGEFLYGSVNEAFSEHISNFNNDDSGSGFLIGNITLDTPGTTAGPLPRDPETAFFQDITRNEEEIAFFGQLSFDITDQVTFSLGARSYKLETQTQGATNFSFGCRFGIGGASSNATDDGRCNGFGFSGDVTNRLTTLGQFAATGDENIILNAETPRGSQLFGDNQLLLDDIAAGDFSVDGINASGKTTERDVIFRSTLDWKPNEDVLVFLTYAEGYRPATQNRSAAARAFRAGDVGSPFENFRLPVVAKTDTLESIEFGVKSEWFNNTLRLNATYYQTETTDLQFIRFDPTNIAFLFFAENAGDSEADGLDIDFQWALANNVTLSGAFAFMDTELSSVSNRLAGTVVPRGSELPLSPDFSGNLRARYDFVLDSLEADAYLSASVTYRGESVSGLIGSAELAEDTLVQSTGRGSGLELQFEGGTFGGTSIADASVAGGSRLPRGARYVNPSATTLNLAAGVQKDSWSAEFFIDNATDESAPIVQIVGKFTPEVTTQRPRTIGLRFSYAFE